jgi:large subunit ribosomal protein L9
MKIVLRDHVEHLGERGQVVDVARGYARNYLLPKGLAYEATPGNMKVLEQQRRVFEARDARELLEARRLAEHVAGLRVEVSKKAGESGTLYGSVTNTELARLLEQHGVRGFDRRRIALREPIKTVGEHTVQLKIHRQVAATLTVVVTAEGGGPAEQAETPSEPDEARSRTDDESEE